MHYLYHVVTEVYIHTIDCKEYTFFLSRVVFAHCIETQKIRNIYVQYTNSEPMNFNVKMNVEIEKKDLLV